MNSGKVKHIKMIKLDKKGLKEYIHFKKLREKVIREENHIPKKLDEIEPGKEIEYILSVGQRLVSKSSIHKETMSSRSFFKNLTRLKYEHIMLRLLLCYQAYINSIGKSNEEKELKNCEKIIINLIKEYRQIKKYIPRKRYKLEILSLTNLKDEIQNKIK